MYKRDRGRSVAKVIPRSKGIDTNTSPNGKKIILCLGDVLQRVVTVLFSLHLATTVNVDRILSQ